jgi:hypothetical protein
MDYGARFYSPTLGRFLQPDTIIPSPANPQSYNRYSYVLNNPLLYIDPTGHEACLDGICGLNPVEEYFNYVLSQQTNALFDGIRPGDLDWVKPDYKDPAESVVEEEVEEVTEKTETTSSVKPSIDHQEPIVELGPWEFGTFYSDSLKLGTAPWSVGYNKFGYGTSNSLGYFGFSFNGSGIFALDVGVIDINATAKYGDVNTSYGRGYSLRINTTGPFLTAKGTGWTQEIRDYHFTANKLDIASHKTKVGFYGRNKNVGTTAMAPYAVGVVGGILAAGGAWLTSALSAPVLHKLPEFFK